MAQEGPGSGRDGSSSYYIGGGEEPDFVAVSGKQLPGNAVYVRAAILRATRNPQAVKAAELLDQAHKLLKDAGIPEPAVPTEYDFNGKTVVITGGASGIGKEAVRRFALSGARVIAIDVNPQLKEKIAQLNEDDMPSIPIETIVADVSKPEQWRDQIKQLDKVDVLLNVAAIIDPPLDPNNPESQPDIQDAIRLIRTPEGTSQLINDAHKVVDSDFIGPYLLSLAIAEKMVGNRAPSNPNDLAEKQKRHGAIINVGSSNVFTLNERRLVYAPQKAAIHLWSQLLAKGLARYGITVNCVAPGATANTAIVKDVANAHQRMPLGINEPSDVVNTMMFLASDRARNMTGQIIAVEGGRTGAAT